MDEKEMSKEERKRWEEKEVYECDDCGAKYPEAAWENLPEIDDYGTVCDSCGGTLTEIEE